eukprot:TRINITY_DN1371_c0_g1_i3.p1 TRINITY_DN1371_c0_g1~~TRINITY_DN1371_c0_g1_i3.p1  ORF type:complete len:1100 (-),score=297.03 TRINITY_DN1371_c0_g1_i3:66-3365(-)
MSSRQVEFITESVQFASAPSGDARRRSNPSLSGSMFPARAFKAEASAANEDATPKGPDAHHRLHQLWNIVTLRFNSPEMEASFCEYHFSASLVLFWLPLLLLSVGYVAVTTYIFIDHIAVLAPLVAFEVAVFIAAFVFSLAWRDVFYLYREQITLALIVALECIVLVIVITANHLFDDPSPFDVRITLHGPIISILPLALFVLLGWTRFLPALVHTALFEGAVIALSTKWEGHRKYLKGPRDAEFTSDAYASALCAITFLMVCYIQERTLRKKFEANLRVLRGQQTTYDLLKDTVPNRFIQKDLITHPAPITQVFSHAAVVNACVSTGTEGLRTDTGEAILILDEIWSTLDILISKYGGQVEKLASPSSNEHIVLCTSVPGSSSSSVSDPSPAADVAAAWAQEVIKEITKLRTSSPALADLKVRIGIDCGEAWMGLVGGERVTYDAWYAPFLDQARKIRDNANDNSIDVSERIFAQLKDSWVLAPKGAFFQGTSGSAIQPQSTRMDAYTTLPRSPAHAAHTRTPPEDLKTGDLSRTKSSDRMTISVSVAAPSPTPKKKSTLTRKSADVARPSVHKLAALQVRLPTSVSHTATTYVLVVRKLQRMHSVTGTALKEEEEKDSAPAPAVVVTIPPMSPENARLVFRKHRVRTLSTAESKPDATRFGPRVKAFMEAERANWFSLRFSERREVAYMRSQNNRAQMWFTRIAIVVWMVMFCVNRATQFNNIQILIRYGVAPLAFLGALGLSFTKRFQTRAVFGEVVMAVMCLIIGGCYTSVYATRNMFKLGGPNQTPDIYYSPSGILVYPFFVIGLCGLRFWPSVVIAWVGAVGYAVTTWNQLAGGEENFQWVYVIYAFILCFFVSVVGYMLQATARQFYLLTECLQGEGDLVQSKVNQLVPNLLSERIKQGQHPVVFQYEGVGMAVVKISGFAPLAKTMGVTDAADLLCEIMHVYESLAAKHGVEYIKYAEETYMVASGLALSTNTIPNYDPAAALLWALEVRDTLRTLFNSKTLPLCVVAVVHTGRMLAGVVGLSHYRSDAWGNDIECPWRLVRSVEAMKKGKDMVCITPEMQLRLGTEFGCVGVEFPDTKTAETETVLEVVE